VTPPGRRPLPSGPRRAVREHQELHQLATIEEHGGPGSARQGPGFKAAGSNGPQKNATHGPLPRVSRMAPHRRRADRVAGGSQAKASEARTNQEQARREPGASQERTRSERWWKSASAHARGAPGGSEASAHAREDASMNGLHARDSSSEPRPVRQRARARGAPQPPNPNGLHARSGLRGARPFSPAHAREGSGR
jgi:hypothetical protein